MPETIEPLNEGPEPDPLAAALRALAPAPPALNRDRLLYEAGRAAALATHRSWMAASGVLTMLSLGLAVWLVFRPPATVVVERLVQVPHPRPEPAPQAHPFPAPAPPPEPAESPESVRPPAVARRPAPDDMDALRKALETRRQVLRWGVEMLPDPAPPVAARHSEEDLKRWLDLPVEPPSLTPSVYLFPYR